MTWPKKKFSEQYKIQCKIYSSLSSLIACCSQWILPPNTNHLNGLIKKMRGSNVVKYTTTSRKMLGKPKLDSTTGMISDTSNSSLDLKGKFSVSVNFTDRQFELILLVSNSYEMKNILKGQIRFHCSPSI